MSDEGTDRLRFVGTTIKGAGKFSEEMLVPGENEIPGKIRDWPDRLEAGTLNVLINHNGYPERFLTEFGSPKTENLDTRKFRPEVELPHELIRGNTLSPNPGQRSDKGNAQVWRAYLTKIESGMSVQCWVLRRITSGMPNRLECVAGVKLRELLSLPEEANDPVELIIEGTWK